MSEDRQLLIWVYEEELSYEELALRLGTTPAACRTRVYRARRNAAKFYKKD